MSVKKYDYKKIEKKWQKYWEENKLHKRGEKGDKYYVLDMFPYPSGDGLHMGHTESYTSTDIIYRYKKLRGFNVLHPQGFDAFGLPAENYAIKTGAHPKETTKKNIKNYIEQMKSLGLGYDFDEKIITSDPSYYRWTQWIFGKFFEAGFVYKKTDTINWCPSCQTGIANEQVDEGKCERCKTEVIQKEVPGWFFKITDFADDLIKDLEKVDWPEATKKNQINWIGKSEGALIDFDVRDSKEKIKVFTTRPDTLFGATYMVLAPENVSISNLKSQISNFDEVQKYIEDTKKKSEMDRIENKVKTGVRLEGVFAINPANKEEIPIFIADYVLSGYGTGAIMAVPAHDTRDWEFAKRFDLKIIEVISGGDPEKEAYVGDGNLINSGELNGLNSEEAKIKITKFVGGELTSNYRLRDWSVSRQRYWGCPIPIVYSPDGEARYVGDENLPWKLPEDVDFVPTGESPLAKSKEFKKRTEKIFGKGWAPEVDTLDTFVDSAWYFLRYPDTKNEKEIISVSRERYWLPVDIYIGGAEHTYMHLLYARFFVKALRKIGIVDFGEPFLKLRHQGMVLDKSGVKMSKSKGNVVNPNEIVKKFGADAVRLYMMFAGPLEDNIMWDEHGITGASRFLEKIWKIFNEKKSIDCEGDCKDIPKELLLIFNKTIKKVTEDIDSLDFNTAISSMMILVNEFSKYDSLSCEVMERFLILLSPFAPHISEELWSQSGHDKSIFLEKWPEYDESKIKEDVFKLVIQINGKVRGIVDMSIGALKEDAEKIALEQESVKKWIDGKKDYKVVFIPNKLINIVIQ